METKLVRVPFNIEMAKKIMNTEIEGRIYDSLYNCFARIVDFNFQSCKGKLNVIVSERGKDKEVYCVCNDKGVIYLDREEKFDDKPIFMLEIPGHLAFKDGDVYIVESGGIAIYNANYNSYPGVVPFYVGLRSDAKLVYCNQQDISGFGRFDESRLATDEEKQKLIKVLKENNDSRAKEYLKRFFNIEIKEECKFKPGQPLLGVDGNGEWRYDIFSHRRGDLHVCSGRSYRRCIPYEGNEHLLGTNNTMED